MRYCSRVSPLNSHRISRNALWTENENHVVSYAMEARPAQGSIELDQTRLAPIGSQASCVEYNSIRHFNLVGVRKGKISAHTRTTHNCSGHSGCKPIVSEKDHAFASYDSYER